MVPVNVFLTVDVESSIGGAFSNSQLRPVGPEKRIFGRFFGREYGLALIMNLAGRYKLPLVFFVETFQQLYFQKTAIKRVVDYILKRNHDIQLHLHPTYLNFTTPRPQDKSFSDLMHEYSLEQQIEMIARAKRMLIDAGAPAPVAFRAGNFGANENTLKALQANGFLIDSSYNQASIGRSCLLREMQRNDVWKSHGIFEFPVTNFRERGLWRRQRLSPLDINGVGFEEMRHVLWAARNGRGPRNVTVVLHSFSFIKPYDVQYRRIRPRWNVILRFKRLCLFLDQNRSAFRVRTFREMRREELEACVHGSIHILPDVPYWCTWIRFAEQAVDRWL